MNTKNVREEQLDLLSAMLGSSPETEQVEAITRETVQSSETIEVDKTCEIKNNTEPCEKLEFKRFSDYGDKIKDPDFYNRDADGFMRASEKIGRLKNRLDEAETRWLELEEMKATAGE